MPELVTCPSCGFKTRMSESLLGRHVRCPGCDQRFVAQGEPEPSSKPSRPPPVPAPPRPGRQRPRTLDEAFPDEEFLPFCPGCGRRVRWESIACPHCGEELEEESHLARAYRRGTRELSPIHLRRDGIPHRGKLIGRLGNACLILGGLSLCIAGLGAVVCVPLGITTWVLANSDLEQMRIGAMDPRGKQETESGRIGAIVGTVISMIFAGFYLLVYAGMF